MGFGHGIQILHTAVDEQMHAIFGIMDVGGVIQEHIKERHGCDANQGQGDNG